MENKKELNLVIQDHTGDRKLKLTWQPGDEEAEKHIEEMFLDLQKKGYRFFSVMKLFGFLEVKGREVKTYDPELGEIIYEAPKEKRKEKKNTLSITEVEKTEKQKRIVYENPKKFNPEKEKIDSSRDYIATKPLRAG